MQILNQRSSVYQFNALVDLEQEYADYRRKNIQGWEDVQKVNQEICSFIDQTIVDHDRTLLSKKLPKSLFSGSPPIKLVKPSSHRN